MTSLFAYSNYFGKHNVCHQQLGLAAPMWHHANMKFRIRQLRRARGWTIDQLADLTSISRGFLSQIETGARQPSVETLSQIAAAFEVPVPDLYSERSATEEALLEVFRRIPASRHEELIRMLEVAANPPNPTNG